MFAFFCCGLVALCSCWHGVFTDLRSNICRWKRLSVPWCWSQLQERCTLGQDPCWAERDRGSLPWCARARAPPPTPGVVQCFLLSSLQKSWFGCFANLCQMPSFFLRENRIAPPSPSSISANMNQKAFSFFKKKIIWKISFKSSLKNSAFQSKVVGVFFPGIVFNFPYKTEHISPASPLKIVCKENNLFWVWAKPSIRPNRNCCILLSSPKKIFFFFFSFFLFFLSHGFPPLFHEVDLGQFLPSPVFSITQVDQKKQPFSCSNRNLNENEKIFQLFLLVSIFLSFWLSSSQNLLH